MIKYTIKRFLQSILTLFFVITIVFLLLRLMPVRGYFDENYEKLDEVQRQAVLKKMGLTDPIHIQLVNFYKNLFKGDLGESLRFRPNVKVTKIIAPKVPYSVKFGLASVGLSIIFGIPMGILAASYKGKLPDKLSNLFIIIINAVPAAVYYLFIQLGGTELLNIPMLYDDSNWLSFILPAFSMSLGSTASYAMWIRRYMIDELNKDYVKLAKAKGLKKRYIMFVHVLKNAFVPLAQYLPSSILYTIGGSLYIESIYSIPGMGGLLVAAIQKQDNTLVQAQILIFSSIGIIGLFLGDILMVLIDPRIKLDRKRGTR